MAMLSGKWKDSLDPRTDYSTLDSMAWGGKFSPSFDFFTELLNSIRFILFSSSYSEFDYLRITLTFL